MAIIKLSHKPKKCLNCGFLDKENIHRKCIFTPNFIFTGIVNDDMLERIYNKCPIQDETVKVGILKLHPNAKIPTLGSDGAACFDIYAVEHKKLLVKQQSAIPTGIALDIPTGYEGVIRPRSRMFSNRIEITLGTIDSDYTGEIKMQVRNEGNSEFTINAGDRIAQLKIQKAPKVIFMEIVENKKTRRGSNGFGWTGK